MNPSIRSMTRHAAVMSLLLMAGCQVDTSLQYGPEKYAHTRNIELVLTPPARAWTLVANVSSSGGRFTATETMVNAMIDESKKAGADALLPLEFAGEGGRAGNKQNGIEQFVYSQDGRNITKGRAVRWESR
ncbi:MAG: hypothetical protein OEV31_03160 [Gammaproteobacteria bacterium]|nr:hypothetical protein [Gammaproteobacteria bacterium]